MRNLAKLALFAMIAVMCVGTLTTTSASAGEILFLNESGKALLFTAESIGAATLRGKKLGVEGTIKCDKSSGHGFALNGSSLAREVHLEFSGKCEQEISGSKGTCTEPIKPVLSYGELGLLNGHILLLVAPESGTEFVEVKCTNGNTKVLGAVIGEFPLNGRDGSLQYNEPVKDLLLLFKASGVKQEPEEIELLGSLMKGVALKVEGFFGEKASEEASALILSDGLTEIAGALGPPDPQRISLRPIKNGTGPCPENATREVQFRRLREFCEYRLENENTRERIKIKAIQLKQENQCITGGVCLEEKGSENSPECKGIFGGAKLGPGGVCFVKLELKKIPATRPGHDSLEIDTLSDNDGTAKAVVRQILE